MNEHVIVTADEVENAMPTQPVASADAGAFWDVIINSPRAAVWVSTATREAMEMVAVSPAKQVEYGFVSLAAMMFSTGVQVGIRVQKARQLALDNLTE